MSQNSRKILSSAILLMVIFLLWKNSDAIALNLQTSKDNLPTISVPFPPADSFNTVPMKTATVELDMFSTRANPTWVLTPANLEVLHSMLNSLPSTEPFEFADNLGYRGFVIEVPESDRTVLVKIYQDKIQYDLEGQTRFLLDRDRKVENWLLMSAKSNLPESLYLKVQNQIQNVNR
ncbi:hypothetical protein Q2T42_19900 [Leptolyngbya boryana CZ1]|uniref:Uncharacterized protein n=1 Tax=Leptolyngbya boryana CZ1 TaxID=3060204 RepID=A0AA97AUB3_LEPBY|nr:hypothetical protein [Leptolyngbya boryana]WNZ44096.1 hypothetical protein Q2T42_19900 [Leptolyngbya boryana CZ1]